MSYANETPFMDLLLNSHIYCHILYSCIYRDIYIYTPKKLKNILLTRQVSTMDSNRMQRRGPVTWNLRCPEIATKPEANSWWYWVATSQSPGLRDWLAWRPSAEDPRLTSVPPVLGATDLRSLSGILPIDHKSKQGTAIRKKSTTEIGKRISLNSSHFCLLSFL